MFNIKKESKYIGKRYGRLVVEKQTILHKAGTKNYYFECQCDCGETTIVLAGNLSNGSTQSCGCLKRERMIKLHAENHLGFIEKTGVKLIESIIESRYKIRKGNRFGVNGVYLNTHITPTTKTTKFSAEIGFQRKSFKLGSYDTPEDAIKIRKEAEQNLYGNFLAWYYEKFPHKKVTA